VRGKRERIAEPSEAAKLLAALPKSDRALWATAFYGGLRLGELQALRWEDVDLATGVLRVKRAWDKVEGIIEPKSRAGVRTVPIAAVLRDYLDAHKTAHDSGYVFGSERPFSYSGVYTRAKRVWKDAGLTPISLHECRHTFASLMIAAGVNAKALTTYLGHSSGQVTLDRYGHLMPGNEEEAAGLLDAYLLRADTAARLAQVRDSRATVRDTL